MTKIVRNDSLAVITLLEVGLDIGVGDSYTLTLDEYLRWAQEDLIAEITPFINSGDLVVNDGTSDLSASDGIRFLQYADRAYIQKDSVDITRVNTTLNFEGDVSVTDNGLGKATVSIGETGQFSGKIIDFIFHSSGNTANKWLGFDNGSTASNTLPLIMPQDGCLVGLTFSNQDNNVDLDIEIYINGTLPINKLYTWEVRNKRYAFLTNPNGGFLDVNQGDRVSLYAKKITAGTGDSTAQDPIIEIFFALNSNIETEGGQQFGDI